MNELVTPKAMRTSAASAAPAAPQALRRRRDAGTVRIGNRDIVGLTWCGEQGTMRLDQLAKLFSQLDRRTVSPDAARKTIGRWLDNGLAQGQVLLAGEAPYYWPTVLGMRTVGLNFPAVPPAIVTLAHSHFVNEVRLFAQRNYPDATWRSERAIKSVLPARQRGAHVPHLPDGELHLQGGAVVAIEAERTPKTIERTRGIQLGLLSRRYDFDRDDATPTLLTPRYAGVWYFTSPAAEGVVRAASSQLPADLASRLRIVTGQ